MPDCRAPRRGPAPRVRPGKPLTPRLVTGLHASAAIPIRFWVAALQQATPVQPPDSVIVKSPLPGGVAAVTRFLLSTVPQWVQLAGLVVAAIVAGGGRLVPR